MVDVLTSKKSEFDQEVHAYVSLDGKIDLHMRIVNCLKERNDHLAHWHDSKESLLDLCQAGEPQIWKHRDSSHFEVGVRISLQGVDVRIPVHQRYQINLLQMAKKADPQYEAFLRENLV